MSKNRATNKKSNSDFTVSVGLPWGVVGFTMGVIATTMFFHFGIRNIDTEPDWETAYPNISFEFPERLTQTTQESVGSAIDPENPSSEESLEVRPNEADSDNSTTLGQAGDGDNNIVEENTDSNESVTTGYVLQVGVFKDKKNANSLRASLLIDGYDAYTTEFETAELGKQHRVIIGPYDSKEASSEDSKRLAERNILTYLVPIKESRP